MSNLSEPQEKAFEFLLKHLNSLDSFTKQEFKAATGYDNVSFKTYWSKQFRPILVEIEPNRFRVSFLFRRFATRDKFSRNVVSQNRSLITAAKGSTHQTVIYEFFMPLRNEEYLRDMLDSLFYEDSLIPLLKTVDQKGLLQRLPKNPGEADIAYLKRAAAWVSAQFAGYSISHVSGRYRADELKTRQTAAADAANCSGRYLVDETTAVVRFIFPCKAPGSDRAEPDEIRWIFNHIFIRPILEIVSDEQEIWLLESGLKTELRIFRAS